MVVCIARMELMLLAGAGHTYMALIKDERHSWRFQNLS